MQGHTLLVCTLALAVYTLALAVYMHSDSYTLLLHCTALHIELLQMLDSTWTKELDDALREGVLRKGESLAAWPRVAQHIAAALELQHACSATEAYQRWAMIRDAPIKGPW
jgi:hypothetical protein